MGRFVFLSDAHYGKRYKAPSSHSTKQDTSKNMRNAIESQRFWRYISRAILQGLLAGVLLGTAFVGGFFYHDVVTKPSLSQASFGLLDEVDGLLAQHFLYEVPDESVKVYEAAKGLVASYNDPYTIFVEPQTAEVDATNLAGKFGGIGVELSRDAQGHFVIARVYRDGPAYEAGLLAGDIILAVDGVELDTHASDMNGILSAIRGNIGEPVTLTILHDGELFDVELTRAEVLVPSTFWRILDTDPRIGYLQVTRFTERTPDEVKQALKELDRQGAQAYVLDLRDNGGGLVDSAIGVASEFLNGGVVLYEEKRGAAERIFNASRGGAALHSPLVVLINSGTASAAEIVAGAFQDRGRAVLIGQKSFGKGSVQLILPVSDGSSLHVTHAQWFTPDHHRLEGQGLTPDVIVEHIDGIDAELAIAIDYLGSQLSVAVHSN